MTAMCRKLPITVQPQMTALVRFPPIPCWKWYGGNSTGAKNPAVKHGYYTKESIAERKWLSQFLEEANDVLAEMPV
jgi:hypothetical protein